MSEMGMIERVARALAPTVFINGGADDQAYWLNAARAAIEAMREPTTAMEVAGNEGELYT